MPVPKPAEQHRRDLATLTSLAKSDLARAWKGFSTVEAARDGLRDILPRLVQVYGMAAATLAADWYDELRDTEGVKGRFRAIPADLPADLGTDSLTEWAITPLFKPDPDWAAAQSLVEGGMTRRIQNVSRETVTGSSVADPSAQGWQRAGSGECAFCVMLIGRGVVYSESSADFASHDHCSCFAVPAFSGQPRLVKPYTPTLKTISDSDKARVREYLRTQ